MDFQRSQEIAGVTSQLELQAAELSSVKAQHMNDATLLTNALKEMEHKYNTRIQQLDKGISSDRAKAEEHIMQLKAEAEQAIIYKDAQIKAQEDQLRAEQCSVNSLKSELSTVMSSLSTMQTALMEQKAEFTHHFNELSAANSQLIFEKSLAQHSRPHTPEPKVSYMPWMDPLITTPIVLSLIHI